nr:hypothetical protein [Tanacetum cinerariifolium]
MAKRKISSKFEDLLVVAFCYSYCSSLRFAVVFVLRCVLLRFALEALHFISEVLAFCLQKILHFAWEALHFVFKDLAFCLRSTAFCLLPRSCILSQKHCDGSPVVQQSGIQCFNCKEFGHFAKECRKPKRVKDSAYHKEKMLLCKQAEQGVPLQAEQYDWLADTDEEIDEQELEAHYSYMAKIQEVPTADSGTDSEPLEQVQNEAGYNMFANDLQYSEQSEYVSNIARGYGRLKSGVVESDEENEWDESVLVPVGSKALNSSPIRGTLEPNDCNSSTSEEASSGSDSIFVSTNCACLTAA